MFWKRFIAWRLYVRNPVRLPGFVPADASPRIRTLLNTLYETELADLGKPNAVTEVIMVISWFGITLITCLTNFSRQRPAIRREHPEIGDWAHIRRLLISAFGNNIAPGEFYQYKFYVERHYRERKHYLVRWQSDSLLRRALPPGQAAGMMDKHHFWQVVSRAGLSTVPVWAVLKNGKWLEGNPADLPSSQTDLVIKPTLLARGEGIEFIDAHDDGTWSLQDRRMTASEMLQYIETRSHEYPILVQPRIRNHPSLDRYKTEGLITLRVLTMNSGKLADPVCLSAAFRIPSDSSRMANYYQGALACSIDPESGLLGPGVADSPASENLQTHPATGAPLAGEKMIFWEECKTLCLDAHRLVPSLNSVGWDVVIDANGPMLLEANLRWGARVLQLTNRAPLLKTRFPELYALEESDCSTASKY